jgi:outer membrane immunogenic protein
MLKRISLAAVAAAGMMCAAQAQPAPVFNWSGLYVGGTVGYGWNQSVHGDAGFFSTPINMNGPVIGGTLGVNFQRGQWVYGVEADLSYADVKGTGQTTIGGLGCGPGCVTQLESFGTVRGRLGFAYNNFLPFITAGFAYGRIYASAGTPSLFRTIAETGWTVGAGVEYAWLRNWSVKVEYLYVELGDKFDYSPTCGGTCVANYDGFNVVRLGVNYRW